mgnify:FL=1
MAIFIENVLDVYSQGAINTVLTDLDHFIDGKKTAGRSAQQVKNNLQADKNCSEIKGATKLIEQALLSHPDFINAAQPQKLAKVILSRYEEGMEYGPHIDDAVIEDTRTDLSFTLFLSDPDSYQGGELVIQQPDGAESIKLAKGSVYVYPTKYVHYVAPVTEGVRFAAIGWVQSHVRLEEHRQILLNVAVLLKQLPDVTENRAIRLQLLQIQSQLQRLWYD